MHIVAICGSLRERSSNRALLQAVTTWHPRGWTSSSTTGWPPSPTSIPTMMKKVRDENVDGEVAAGVRAALAALNMQ